jgi:hypothetical protein
MHSQLNRLVRSATRPVLSLLLGTGFQLILQRLILVRRSHRANIALKNALVDLVLGLP